MMGDHNESSFNDYNSSRARAFEELLVQIDFCKKMIKTQEKPVSNQKQQKNVNTNQQKILDQQKDILQLETIVKISEKQLLDNNNKFLHLVECINADKKTSIENHDLNLKKLCEDNNTKIKNSIEELKSMNKIYSGLKLDTQYNEILLSNLIEQSEKLIQSCYFNTPIVKSLLKNTDYDANNLHKASQTTDNSGVYYARSQHSHTVNRIRDTSKSDIDKFNSMNKFGQSIKADQYVNVDDKLTNELHLRKIKKQSNSGNIQCSNNNSNTSGSWRNQSKPSNNSIIIQPVIAKINIRNFFNIGAGNSELPVSDFEIIKSNESALRPKKITPLSDHQNQNKLRDRILQHKNSAIIDIVNNTYNMKCTNFIISKNQIEAKYPCLIILFSKYDEKKSKNNYGLQTGYQDFSTHLMIACINHELKKSGGPFIERRQSFGFLTPTMADVKSGLRLSLGLVPNEEWLKAVKRGIGNCDQILNALPNDFKCDEYDSNNIMTTIGHRIIQVRLIPVKIHKRLQTN